MKRLSPNGNERVRSKTKEPDGDHGLPQLFNGIALPVELTSIPPGRGTIFQPGSEVLRKFGKISEEILNALRYEKSRVPAKN
jgi:hypothetical protein